MAQKRATASNKDTQVTGNIGLFHVCYELSRRGFNVTPTLGNTVAVDLIVGSTDFKHHKSVQVKTHQASNATSPEIGKTSKLKTKKDALKKASLADFWVHVLLADDNSVSHVFVWKGADEKLIKWNETNWFFPTQRAETREIWARHKDELGWKLIESALK